MPHSDALRWDERYARERDEWLERGPRQLLVEHAHRLPSRGLALDAAAGVSASGLFLARRGLRVIALDISEYALHLAVQRARAERLPLEAAVLDLSDPWLPEQRFDVVLNFRFLSRAAFPVYRRALKRGGILFFESYVKLREDLPDEDYYLLPGELLQAFKGFEILHWEERQLPASAEHAPRGLASLVARKA